MIDQTRLGCTDGDGSELDLGSLLFLLLFSSPLPLAFFLLPFFMIQSIPPFRFSPPLLSRQGRPDKGRCSFPGRHSMAGGWWWCSDGDSDDVELLILTLPASGRDHVRARGGVAVIGRLIRGQKDVSSVDKSRMPLLISRGADRYVR